MITFQWVLPIESMMASLSHGSSQKSRGTQRCAIVSSLDVGIDLIANGDAYVSRSGTAQTPLRSVHARDMEAALDCMDQDVIWANGMECGHVYGREGVHSYWTRQWAMIDPHVEPVGFSTGSNGEVIVEFHQLVRDLQGRVLVDRMVGHIFQIENGLVKRFDIRGA
jgi:hypothetical protein